ncbi:hypothetical protein BpHYR1_016460 [Brachionus plicatilis]|uniref:Uncharacterized protein n=1 Tax=Brachionus plicatilis TaxID=10195 RepID=A0A3M7RZE5_BRAPC|nr:hypothetical protein BpHYR1_016460 [Brachionus plicatilis]
MNQKFVDDVEDNEAQNINGFNSAEELTLEEIRPDESHKDSEMKLESIENKQNNYINNHNLYHLQRFFFMYCD